MLPGPTKTIFKIDLRKRISRGGQVFFDRLADHSQPGLAIMNAKDYLKFNARHSTLLEDKIGKEKFLPWLMEQSK